MSFQIAALSSWVTELENLVYGKKEETKNG
jgi:hypothetical protein